ncbi:MAG: hypothetical protein BLM47_04450 [Candidatus Reconcilbacillus cellulovorans]|uniref:Damage-inducible protein DinB n=1 Tax=Candidatus Reconcilbacillus cellulovorans TaxID=1906605 RepID=A0A2A6E293_9BACL|nr:MAG: hypothetical protein BLM47_04450 [Candidatus Reconcilbacillus cellulovorans]
MTDGPYRLLDYRAWARERVLAAVEQLRPELFVAPVVSSFSSIRDTLVHLLWADAVWTSRIKGAPFSVRLDPDDFPNVQALKKRWDPLDEDLNMSVKNLVESVTNPTISYQTTKGEKYVQPLYQIVQHLVNHQTYHLGQVAAMIRQLGGKPPSIDLIEFDRISQN